MEEQSLPTGPPVADNEDVYRRLSPEWYIEGRISSAAFSWPRFSVDRARLTTPGRCLLETLEMEGFRLAAFNCGDARELGFDTREELDPNFPDNLAHAHVYYSMKGSQRKKAARALADHATIIHIERNGL